MLKLTNRSSMTRLVKVRGAFRSLRPKESLDNISAFDLQTPLAVLKRQGVEVVTIAPKPVMPAVITPEKAPEPAAEETKEKPKRRKRRAKKAAK